MEATGAAEQEGETHHPQDCITCRGRELPMKDCLFGSHSSHGYCGNGKDYSQVRKMVGEKGENVSITLQHM